MIASEFSVYDQFNHLLSRWWLIALATLLGGILGFIIFQLRPPLYEATATYLVTIDLNRFPLQTTQEDLMQYNEDLALNTTKGVLLSNDVLDQVINQVNNNGITISKYDLLHRSTIERKQETWELRYRSEIPQDARMIVNIWAGIGYQAMISWQETGKVPPYVIFNSPAEALTPQEPVYYDRNRVMLAGVFIGFITGILVSNLINRPSNLVHPDQ